MTAAAPPSPAPLLELSTLAPLERPFITIDGERYDMLVPADFSLLSLNRLDQMAARVDAMQARQKSGPRPLNDREARELTSALKTVVAEIVRAPAAVLERLSDVQRFQVLTAFTPASREQTAPAKPNRAARRQRRRTGASSSPASAASTAPSTG